MGPDKGRQESPFRGGRLRLFSDVCFMTRYYGDVRKALGMANRCGTADVCRGHSSSWYQITPPGPGRAPRGVRPGAHARLQAMSLSNTQNLVCGLRGRGRGRGLAPCFRPGPSARR